MPGAVRWSPLDEPFGEAAGAAQPPLDARHLTAILLVVVPEQVQQPVQRQNAQFGGKGVTGELCLSARDTGRDHDVTEQTGLAGGEGQYVRDFVVLSILPVQCADAGVGHEGNRHCAPRAPWRDDRQPMREPWGTKALAGDDFSPQASGRIGRSAPASGACAETVLPLRKRTGGSASTLAHSG